MSLLIGKNVETPVIYEGDNVLHRFLYSYEMTFARESFAEIRNDIPAWLEAKASEYPYYETLEPQKKWWMYNLIIQKQIAEYYKHPFASNLCETFLRSIPMKSEKDLQMLCTSYQYSVSEVIVEIMIVRPRDRPFLDDLPERDPFIQVMFEQIPLLTKYLKRNIRQKDFNFDYLNSIWLPDRKIFKTFGSTWESFTEIFLSYMFALYDIQLQTMEETDHDERVAILVQLAESFLLMATTLPSDEVTRIAQHVTEQNEIVAEIDFISKLNGNS